MDIPTRTEEFDAETGEIKSGLPVGYQSGNQSLAVSIAMAEVDQQITTAHAYPRSVDLAVKNILSLATLDEETAAECVYALPRGGKPIKGPSVRLAEIIQSQWGNNRVGTRVVHVDRVEKYVEAEGVFHDLQTNAATTARVRRRISDKQGRVLSDDMIVVTGNAAASIAKRNAILGGVPKAVWRRAYAAVEQVIAGDIKTLSVRRADAMKAFAAFGVTPERVCEALEVGGLDDVTLEHMPTLIGMHSALKNGEYTVEEMFPPKRPAGEPKKSLGEKLEHIAGDKKHGATSAQDRSPSSDGPVDEIAETSAAPVPRATEKPSGPSHAAAPPPPSDMVPRSDGGPLTPAQARADGAAAKAAGRGRVSVDVKYRSDERLLEAWLDGWTTGEAEDREPGEEAD